MKNQDKIKGSGSQKIVKNAYSDLLIKPTGGNSGHRFKIIDKMGLIKVT